MDRYGNVVSNNYHGHAMAGMQSRAVAGAGGCRCSSYNQRQPLNMPTAQAPCGGCRQKPLNAGPIVTQPMANGNGMMAFSQEGREWTTGKCGCFQHCGSCTYGSDTVYMCVCACVCVCVCDREYIGGDGPVR